MSRFLCVAIPDFPAWAALRCEPGLRGKPLLIYSRGRVVAASAEARAAGVRDGWPLERARALLPEAEVRLHSGAITAAAWEAVLQALYELSPWLEPSRPGLVMAEAMDESAIVALLGEWQARGGIADDRTTAELAAYTARPGDPLPVQSGCSQTFVAGLPSSLLREVGVGDDTLQRLSWFGWNTLGRLRRVTRRQLVAQFAEGELIYRYVRCADARPVASYRLPDVITAARSFDEPVTEPGAIEPALPEMIEQAGAELDGRTARTLTLALDTSEGRRHDRRLLHEPARAARTLLHPARAALEAVMAAPGGYRPPLVYGIELQLGGLLRPPPVQGLLFGRRRPSALAAINAVDARFPDAMRKVVTLDPHAYLPEEGFRLEPVGTGA